MAYHEFTSIFYEEVIKEDKQENIMNKFNSKFIGKPLPNKVNGSAFANLNKSIHNQDNIYEKKLNQVKTGLDIANAVAGHKSSEPGSKPSAPSKSESNIANNKSINN